MPKRKPIPERIRQAVFERDNNQCQQNRIPHICKGALTIGHIIPHALGGTNDLDNLQAECAFINYSEGKTIRRNVQKLRAARSTIHPSRQW